MPATFDYQGDETSWHQGLLPGEVGPQLSELEFSESDSDGSTASILGVCLHGFHGDAWMSDAEGAHDDMQVGAAVGVNDPGDIPWYTIGDLQEPAFGDNNEDQGGTEGGVSVGGNRARWRGCLADKREEVEMEKWDEETEPQCQYNSWTKRQW